MRTYMRRAAIALALLVISGCGDGSGTEPEGDGPFVVEWSSAAAELQQLESGSYICTHDLVVEASGGTAEDFAAWEDSGLRLRYTDGTTSRLLDVPAVDLLDAFGVDRVRSGERLSAKAGWWQSVREHDTIYALRYRLEDGTIKSDEVRVDCT